MPDPEVLALMSERPADPASGQTLAPDGTAISKPGCPQGQGGCKASRPQKLILSPDSGVQLSSLAQQPLSREAEFQQVCTSVMSGTGPDPRLPAPALSASPRQPSPSARHRPQQATVVLGVRRGKIADFATSYQQWDRERSSPLSESPLLI